MGLRQVFPPQTNRTLFMFISSLRLHSYASQFAFMSA
jgi:hypothetical protein